MVEALFHWFFRMVDYMGDLFQRYVEEIDDEMHEKLVRIKESGYFKAKTYTEDFNYEIFL